MLEGYVTSSDLECHPFTSAKITTAQSVVCNVGIAIEKHCSLLVNAGNNQQPFYKATTHVSK